MPMISPLSVDHLVYRVSALDQTDRFYTALLGQQPSRSEHSLMYQVGDTRLFFSPSAQPLSYAYDKEQIGLNHIAFGISTLTELQALEKQFDTAGIAHSGIKIDSYGLKEFIWLDDPDGMRIEFYLRPQA
jgi:glyoxylase I family protein